ncbi:MAG: hypothetical protein JNK82_35265 [Myxococcaceae bacterium]|nr:hypothetical protein [Myxococcaceae bacterium]
MTTNLLKTALKNLNVPQAKPSVLAPLPDGTYKIPAKHLGEERSFTVDKKGNGGTIRYRDTFYALDPEGKFRIDDTSHAIARHLEGQVTLNPQGGISADVVEVIDWANPSAYGGGKAEKSERKHWRGAVALDGTSLTPSPEQLEVLVSGQLETKSLAKERREDGSSPGDGARHVTGKLTLMTDDANTLYLKVPSSLTGGVGDLTVPVKNGGVLATGSAAGWSWKIEGRVENGAVSVKVSFDGSSLQNRAQLNGSF